MPNHLIAAALTGSLLSTAVLADEAATKPTPDTSRPAPKTKSPSEPPGETAVKELDPIVVSAPLEERVSETARPVSVLTGEALRERIGPTIGETLKQEPGVNSQSFGPGVGLPVIRGQTGPRVQVMTNSLGTGDVSQLSPDHANAVEPVLADRVEVLRGPATLLYGSGAIGGIVNVIDNRIPGKRADKWFSPTFEQRFNSVSDETTSNLKVEGGEDLFAFHLDGFYRDSNNLHIGGPAIDESAARQSDPALAGTEVLQNSFGVIPNTSARAKGGTAGFSLVGDPGFAGFAINYLGNDYGIPPDGAGGPNVRINLKQTRYSFKSELTEPFELAEAVRMWASYIDYSHTELSGGVPGARFFNETYEGRLEFAHKPLGPFKGVIGFQGRSGNLLAYEEEDGAREAILPRSQISNYGVFAVESAASGPVSYEVGVRGESSTINPDQPGLDRSYAPISASGSAQWKINPENSISFAVTRSQRAPQVQELYFNGPHDATRSFELGDPNLTMETSYNIDLGYRLETDWASGQLNLFQNWVDDYIFQQQLAEVFNEDSGEFEAVCTAPGACLPILESQQAAASFMGFEGNVRFPLMENDFGVADLTLFSDYTRGQFVQGGNVPRMPPLRYGFQFDYAPDDAWSAYVRLTRGEKQEYAGLNETETNGWVLLNVAVQYQVTAFGTTKILAFAQGNNLLNDNIRNSTSYIRNFAPEPGRGALLGVRMSY